MLKIFQKFAKMTQIAQKKAKNIKKLLEKPKISIPVNKLALTASATFSISGQSSKTYGQSALIWSDGKSLKFTMSNFTNVNWISTNFRSKIFKCWTSTTSIY